MKRRVSKSIQQLVRFQVSESTRLREKSRETQREKSRERSETRSTMATSKSVPELKQRHQTGERDDQYRTHVDHQVRTEPILRNKRTVRSPVKATSSKPRDASGSPVRARRSIPGDRGDTVRRHSTGRSATTRRYEFRSGHSYDYEDALEADREEDTVVSREMEMGNGIRETDNAVSRGMMGGERETDAGVSHGMRRAERKTDNTDTVELVGSEETRMRMTNRGGEQGTIDITRTGIEQPDSEEVTSMDVEGHHSLSEDTAQLEEIYRKKGRDKYWSEVRSRRERKEEAATRAGKEALPEIEVGRGTAETSEQRVVAVPRICDEMKEKMKRVNEKMIRYAKDKRRAAENMRVDRVPAQIECKVMSSDGNISTATMELGNSARNYNADYKQTGRRYVSVNITHVCVCVRACVCASSI